MRLTQIKGISDKKEELFFKLKIKTVSDLVSYFPRSYIDLSTISTLDSALNHQERILICAEVVSSQRIRLKKPLTLTQVKIKDSFATAYLNIFGNQPYYSALLKPSKKFFISGQFQFKNGKIQSSQFSIEASLDEEASLNPDEYQNLSDSLHYLRIVPFYHLTPGISQKLLRESIHQALKMVVSQLQKENLPLSLIKKYDFMDRQKSLQEIHFPSSFELLNKALHRFKYFELFKLQFQFALKKYFFAQNVIKIQKYPKTDLVEKITESLPFQLTGSQQEVIAEIQQDLNKSAMMHRLLLGDVGSGKTLIALLAAAQAINNGYQVAFLAPTEALAKQHFLTASKLLTPFFMTPKLLTGATKSKEKQTLSQDILSGECLLIIGTHAIFSENIQYKNLALIIIDEQHKFGVHQRSKLVGKTVTPDLLIMSATPIPRTLAYNFFGDLETSILREKPQGRQKIKTIWYTQKSLDVAYELIKKKIQQKEQGYIIYPVIEESGSFEIQSLTKAYTELKETVFKNIRIGLIHGKMAEEEKNYLLDQFYQNKISLLLSTTVIEVGIDVPNATFIMIQDAHRFGLSSLHQLRGRVGRGAKESFCLVITPEKEKLASEAVVRINVIENIDDGFLIAEKDLELRGSGNLLGYEQKGDTGLKIASLITDQNILEQARIDAFEIIEQNPDCSLSEYVELKPLVDQFKKKYHPILYN